MKRQSQRHFSPRVGEKAYDSPPLKAMDWNEPYVYHNSLDGRRGCGMSFRQGHTDDVIAGTNSSFPETTTEVVSGSDSDGECKLTVCGSETSKVTFNIATHISGVGGSQIPKDLVGFMMVKLRLTDIC
jgi:hypothetical protein